MQNANAKQLLIFFYLIASIILLFLLSTIIIDSGVINVMCIGFIVCIYALAFLCLCLVHYTCIVICNHSQVFYYYVLIIRDLS
jgi:hypothetical protein